MKDLYTLFKIKETEKFSKYIKMTNQEFNPETLELMLPSHAKQDFKLSLKNADDLLKNLDEKLYTKRFKAYKNLILSLQRAKINSLYFKLACNMENNATILHNLKSFKPLNGYANKVNYNLVGTVTGRLVNTVESPKILTLPSRCRNIFESHWGKEGKLVSIDFKTLEPRLARKLNKKESSDDIYKELSDKLEYNVDRSIIKRAVISILYGSESQLKELSKERSEAVLSAVRDYFNLESLLSIANNTTKNGFRQNYYGRPLHNLEETNNNKIINNYIQSTAVDIALDYFCNLVNYVDIELCRPLFIIHDAIIFDVNLTYMEELKKIVNKGYNCLELGCFPLSLTDLIEEK